MLWIVLFHITSSRVLRSTLAHGQKLGQLSEPDRQLYESMETTLRLALLRAIEDDVFAAMLTNADETKKHWPI
jgi:hypothetical protein